jgi:hypothetical protein
MNPIHQRDGGMCVMRVPGVCRGRAESTDHRIHGNRKDRRPSNLLSTCGDGTTGCHGWKEAHPAEAAARRWTVTRHGHVDTATVPVWMDHAVYGPGWYLLDNEYGLNPTEAPS